jgi:CSLREA domain-containing protein
MEGYMKKVIIFKCLVFFLILLSMGQAATFPVTKTADTNDGTCDADCSLREAIIAANTATGADVITLPAGTYILSIAGTDEYEAATGDLDIRDGLTINGAGFPTTIIDGGAIDRVLQIFAEAPNVNISAVTIQNGFSGSGGGIATWAGTNLSLDKVVIKNNRAIDGGGIANDGTLLVIKSTFSGNETTDSGGAIANSDNGILTVKNSTFENNDASSKGGAISTGGLNASVNIENSTFTGNGPRALYVGSGTVTVNNCTFASNDTAVQRFSGSLTIGNTIIADSSPGDNCIGTFTSGGHNLSSDNSCAASLTGPIDLNNIDPVLGSLADNGGLTLTFALLSGSPAIDAGDDVSCPGIDQRGVTRPQGSACDIGAYEYEYKPFPWELFIPALIKEK